MSKINKKLFTYHGYKRATERVALNPKELQRISLWAIKNGINPHDIPEGALKKYVLSRVNRYHKRIKLYRGYVFIFFETSRRMITCYPVPERFLDEYKKILAKSKKIT